MDIALSYIEKGTGKPLIMLHGNGGGKEYFRAQIEYFSRDFRVIAVDTRGHGGSPRGTEPFTIEQFSEDFHDFMDEKGIEKADILGFSDGGNIALLFALKYPERTDHLILNGANLYPHGVRLSVQIPIELGFVLNSLISPFSVSARERASMLGLMVKEPHISVKRLSALRVPTLVIAGTNDMIRDSHTRKIHKNIPDARLCIMEGDHFIAEKEPEKFNKTVMDFLVSGGGE